MIAFLCALVNICLIIYCLASKKSIFHPVCLLNAMWMAVNVLNAILGWNSAEPAYIILVFPPLFFSLGFFAIEKNFFMKNKFMLSLYAAVAKLSDKYRIKERKVIAATAKLFHSVRKTYTETFELCMAALTQCKIGTRFIDHVCVSVTNKPYTLHGMYTKVSNTLFGFDVVVFIGLTYAFASRLGQYDHGNLWYTLRVIIWDYHVTDWFIFKYSSPIVLLLPSILLIAAQKSKKRIDMIKFLISLVMAVIWSILLTSRTATFQAIIILVMSQILLMEHSDKPLNASELAAMRKKKVMLFAAAVVFILLMFTVIALKKNGDLYGDVSLIEFFLKSIANYTNLSSAAFVEWYKQGFTYTYGATTFRFVIAVLNRLGLIAAIPAANEGGIFITFEGLPTNALTVARAYVEDFGVIYMALVMMVFGIIHGAVYKRACENTGLKRIRYALINAMLDVPLFFQILTNLYLNVLSGWIQTAFWCCVFTSMLFWVKTEQRDEKLSKRRNRQ